MKIQVLSDLHLEFASYKPAETDADVIVLAGDIAVGSNGVTWAKKAFDVPVLYVPGNHEFYTYEASMNTILDEMRSEADGSNIHVMDRDSFEFEGVRFFGTTLWTDLLERPFGGVVCGLLGSDSCRIGLDDGELFNNQAAQELFITNREWLKVQLNQPFNGKTVVVSHHAPSAKSMHPYYAHDGWNSCFISDLEYLMGDRIDLWIHGHTHNNFNYELNGTHVVCNPRGYPAPFGGWENEPFDSAMVIKV